MPLLFAQAIYQLPPITTSTSLPVQDVSSDHLGNQIVISAAQIQREGVTSLAELLNHIGGMRYDAGAGANPQLFIRNKPALVLMDGVPLTSFSLAAPDLSLIDVGQVKEIIITPGSAGTEYGDGAIGGVVNVITQAPQHRRLALSVLGGWPEMGGVGVQAEDAFNNGWSGSVGGQVQKTGGYRQYSKSIAQNMNGLLRKTYQTGYVTWRTQWHHQDIEYPGSLTAAQVAQDRQQAGDVLGLFRYNALDNVMHWHQTLANAWQSDTVLHHNQLWGVANYTGVPDSSQLARTVSLNQSWQHPQTWLHLPVRWTFGLNATRDDYYYAQDINASTRYQYAGYVQSDWQLPDAFGVALGGRYTWVNTQGQFYEWNGSSAVLQPEQQQIQSLWLSSIEFYRTWKDQLKTYIRRVQSYQLPFIDQSSYSTNTVEFLTGFGLQPQTATSYETGFTWKPANWQVNSELYLMDVDNEIGYAAVSSTQSANINLPPTRHIGALMGAEYSPVQQWQLGGQFNASRQWFTQGDNVGKQLPDAPEWIASVDSRYYFTDHWSIYGQTQYTGSSFADSDFANAYGKIAGYWLVNTALNYQVHAWTVSARIDNLTNTYYNAYAAVSGNAIGYYPAPGRTYLLSLNYVMEN